MVPARIDGHSVAGLELFDVISDRLYSTHKLMTKSYRIRALGAEFTLSRNWLLTYT